MIKLLSVYLGLIIITTPTFTWGLDAQNINKLQTSLGFSQFYSQVSSKNIRKTVRVAIFDNGFTGYEKFIGKTLPKNTTFYDAQIETNDNATGALHGLFMAQIVYAMMTDSGRRPEFSPELLLFKVTGYSNLKLAIDEAIRLNVDIILHPMVREYGSNLDGRGFFNAEVSRATKAGIIWVNAAGNYGKTVYNLKQFQTNSDGWVVLPGPNQSLPIRCIKPARGSDVCNLRLILSWNDFKDDPQVGTDKDLDLILTDDTLNILMSSSLTQTKEEKTPPGKSKYPREIINIQVKPGRYFVRVKNRSQNFGARDALRISADSEYIVFENYDENENIFNPADNPEVITVGASDSERSSKSKTLNKPDIFSPSLVSVTNNEAYLGSSNASSIVTAGVALTKMLNPNLGLSETLQLLRTTELDMIVGNGLPTSTLGFGPTVEIESANKNAQSVRACFAVIDIPNPFSTAIRRVLSDGGVFVKTTTGRIKLVTLFDPVRYLDGQKRSKEDDMIVATPQNFVLRSRSEQNALPAGWVEVVQLPQQTSTCTMPEAWRKQASSNPNNGKNFKIPAINTLIKN